MVPTINRLVSAVAVAALAVSLLLAGCRANTESRPVAIQDSLTINNSFDNTGIDNTSDQSLTITTNLQDEVQAIVDMTDMTVSVSYGDLEGETGDFNINGSDRHVAASMIKLVILAELLDQVDQHEHSLDEQVTVSAGDIVGGTGVIQNMGGETPLTLRELATYMIADSDNTAANILIDMLGMGAINAEAEALSLDGTLLQRKMMDETAVAQGIENYMSADDIARILSLIYQGQLINSGMSDFALSILEQQNLTGGLFEGLPYGTKVANKTGTLEGVENDGVIVLATQPYVLVVMVEGITSSSQAMDLTTSISKTVYEETQ